MSTSSQTASGGELRWMMRSRVLGIVSLAINPRPSIHKKFLLTQFARSLSLRTMTEMVDRHVGTSAQLVLRASTINAKQLFFSHGNC